MVTMSKYEWVFFDFDGTLIDSLNVMYQVYEQFLNEFGQTGNENEFSNLNGPTLAQIVTYLKKKYSLPNSEKILLEKYQQKVESAFINDVKAFEGRDELLNFLKKNSYKLALVTSSSKNIVNAFLEKNNWIHFFDEIIYGDEIKESKPNPEIYQKCLSKTNASKNKVLVIEDSENGCASAMKIGLKCVNVTGKSNQDIKSLFK